MGEVSNLSEETGRSRIDFLRGNRGGMQGWGLKGTWESLTYKGTLRSGKVFYRQSEELIVARRKGWTSFLKEYGKI